MPGFRKKEMYVDNAKFFAELKRYRSACMRAHDAGRDKPRVSDYLAECFLKIATRISYKTNFVAYTYRDDLISDGVENCLVYIHNFDPEKSTNPFGYFTTIIHYAFIRRIQREKKHTYIKYRLLERQMIDGTLATNPDTGGVGFDVNDGAMLSWDNVREFVERYETHAQKRRQRRKSRGRKQVIAPVPKAQPVDKTPTTRTESVEEFLARGGKIQHVAAGTTKQCRKRN